MQFKNPEVLYFLALLIIPILVHLFQLQKFVKVPFTNVAFLQTIQQQSRKSSRLKKWLILCTRLLLFTAIIFAFSEPYFSPNNHAEEQHYFIYLDTSLSTSTSGEKGNLLKIAAQEIIENTPVNNSYSLLTNTDFYKKLNKKELKKVLLSIENSTLKLDLKTVLLKIKQENKNKSKTLHRNILISDFQTTYDNKFTNVTTDFTAIQLVGNQKNNISIDSVFISNKNSDNFTVHARIKNQGPKKENVPIALFNVKKLRNKQTFFIEKNTTKEIQFRVNNTGNFLGKLKITFNDIFLFDNSYFFAIDTKKTNVLAIGNTTSFLSKIYTEETFKFEHKSLPEVNYNTLEKQELIILNELEIIPEVLAKKLAEFSKNGGSIVIVPSEKLLINTYNTFLRSLNLGKIGAHKKDTLKITAINYEHPLFKNVFSKRITNFQYPIVRSYTPISGVISKIVSFENNAAFISQLGNKKVYYISSALNTNNSNFINAPLIVPIFYNLGAMSARYPILAYRAGQKNTIEIATKTNKNQLLTIENTENSFIPVQQASQNKITITTKKQPKKAGFYAVLKENIKIQDLAYNAPLEESLLNFLDFNKLRSAENITVSSSIKEVFKKIVKNNEVHWLWKWFLVLAIVSLFLEILILKFYTP
ncbi:MAG: BatA domain-containing protein [Flavobacteriales bacterium]